MGQNKAARYVEVRARLRFHEDLDPGLYDLISGTPQGLRGELLHTLLTRAAPTMGLQTRVPCPAPFQSLTASSAGTANAPTAAPQQVPDVKDAQQGTPVSTSTPPKNELQEHSYAATNKSIFGLEALGIRSLADWNDAFDYSTPPK